MANKGKYDLSSTRKLKFMRFGGLSSVNQRGYGTDKVTTFHSPPARRGIYSFVWPLMEMFLLGGDEFINPKMNKGEINRVKYVRDSDGNPIDSNHPDFESICEKHPNKYWSIGVDKKPDEDGDIVSTRWVLIERIRPKTYEYDGDIWHHLVQHAKEYEVLARNGSWIKTTMETYKKCLRKEAHKITKDYMKEVKYYDNPTKKNESLAYCRAKGLRMGMRDHFEVFVEKV
jgi:hypothetical protein